MEHEDINSECKLETIGGEGYLELIDRHPFGVFFVDTDFKLSRVSKGAQSVFSGVSPLIGRDFEDIGKLVWLEKFAIEAIARFRHTLQTGEAYVADDARRPQAVGGKFEDYDWRIERIKIPGGIDGIICYFYDLSDHQQYATALKESENRFRSIVENVGTGIAIADLTGTTMECNAAFAATLDCVPQDLIGRPLTANIHPDEIADTTLLLQKMASGEVPSREANGRSIRQAGDMVWVHRHYAVLTSAENKPEQIVLLETDLTSVRRARMREELLMRELAHRGKNLLAIIQSIANYSFAGDDKFTRARSAFQGRIQALARTYGALTDDAFEGATLDALLASELGAHLDRITIEGPVIMLTAKAAQTFSLVIHELATNATQFGSLSTDAGSLDISWRIDDADGRHQLVFDWIEKNGPHVIMPSTHGFGTTILSSMATAEFGFPPSLEYRPDGLRYRLTAPLPAAGRARPVSILRSRIRNSNMRLLYDMWMHNRGLSDQPPLFVFFNRDRFKGDPNLVVVEVNLDGELRILPNEQPIDPSKMSNAERDFVDDNMTAAADAYRRCARDGQPCYEHSRFDFGRGETSTFERLLVPYAQSNRRGMFVVSLSVFDDDSDRSPFENTTPL